MADGSALIFTWSYFFATQSVMLDIIDNFKKERLQISMSDEKHEHFPIPDIGDEGYE